MGIGLFKTSLDLDTKRLTISSLTLSIIALYPAMSLPLRIFVNKLYDSTELMKTAALSSYTARIIFFISFTLLRFIRNSFAICSYSYISLAKI